MTFSKEWQLIPTEQKEIISRYHNTAPIKIGTIAKELGLTVKSSTLQAGISGEIRYISGKYIIRVNRHDPKVRQRFTVAHEVAHFLIHRDRIGDGIVDDILYRSSLSDTLEAQANRVAADLLMPWDMIQEFLKCHRNLKPEMRLEKLAEELEVSSTALKIRLGKL